MTYHISEKKNYAMTREEAFKFLRNVRKQPGGKLYFYVRVRTELPILEIENRVFPGYATVDISRPQAIEFADNLLPEALEKRGAAIQIECHKYSFYEDEPINTAIYL